MNSFTNVHLAAHSHLRNAVQAVAQKKWASAYAEQLALKASLINQQLDTNILVSGARSYSWAAYSSATEEPIRKLIDKVTKMTHASIKIQRDAFNVLNDKDLIAPIGQLHAASLADKRAVLRSVHLVSAPVAAAYLGITTAAMNQFTDYHFRAIGDRYARGYCLSIDEVFLIEENHQWLAGAVTDKGPCQDKIVDGSTFDFLLYVSEKVACAFTDMTPYDLSKAAKRGSQELRPYRLADLEKIRVAKLKKMAH